LLCFWPFSNPGCRSTPVIHKWFSHSQMKTQCLQKENIKWIVHCISLAHIGAAAIQKCSDVQYEIFYILTITIIAHKIYHNTIVITIYNFEWQWSHKVLNWVKGILSGQIILPTKMTVNTLPKLTSITILYKMIMYTHVAIYWYWKFYIIMTIWKIISR